MQQGMVKHSGRSTFWTPLLPVCPKEKYKAGNGLEPGIWRERQLCEFDPQGGGKATIITIKIMAWQQGEGTNSLPLSVSLSPSLPLSLLSLFLASSPVLYYHLRCLHQN